MKGAGWGRRQAPVGLGGGCLDGRNAGGFFAA